MEKVEMRLGDPAPQSWIERAKADLKSKYRVLKLSEFKDRNDVEIHIYRPSIRVDAIAADKYAEAYNKYLRQGLPTKDEMAEILAQRGIWGEKQEKEIESLRDDMRNLEFAMAKLRSQKSYNKASANRIRKDWNSLREKLESALTRKNSFLNQTVEGRAEEESLKVKISLCVKYPDDTLVWKSLQEFEEETDKVSVIRIIQEFLLFSSGLTQEIIDGLPEHLFDAIGEDNQGTS